MTKDVKTPYAIQKDEFFRPAFKTGHGNISTRFVKYATPMSALPSFDTFTEAKDEATRLLSEEEMLKGSIFRIPIPLFILTMLLILIALIAGGFWA